MRNFTKLAALILGFASFAVRADLEPWKDYDISESVWSVTTVRVDSNMGDAYLEGLRETWVPGNEISKKLGQIEDYWIYSSDLPDSGDFNLLLVVKFKDTDALAPNKARYDAFMKAYTKDRSDKATAKAQKDYPGMRKLTGNYLMREIKFK
ncbi:MAG: hypothetical protein WC809_09580 [Sinimarinibacterium sp.]|jgi:hypothetical protein